LLSEIPKKERGVDINPTYEGNNIRFSVVFIGRQEVIRTGLKPYWDYINNCISNEIYTIYILAAGKFNIAMAQEVARHFEKHEKIQKVVEEQYKLPFREGRRASSILILFKERIFGAPITR